MESPQAILCFLSLPTSNINIVIGAPLSVHVRRAGFIRTLGVWIGARHRHDKPPFALYIRLLYELEFICLQGRPPNILSDMARRLAAARVSDRPAKAKRRQQ
jgi:hypothetical protein